MANTFYAPFGLTSSQADQLVQNQTDRGDLPYIQEAFQAYTDYWNKMREAGMDADVFKGTPEGASLAQKMEMARQKVLGSQKGNLPSFSVDSVGADIAKYSGREQEDKLLSTEVPIGAIDSRGQVVTRSLREILTDPSLQDQVKNMDASAKTDLARSVMQSVDKRYAQTAQSLLNKAGLTASYDETEDYAASAEKTSEEQAKVANEYFQELKAKNEQVFKAKQAELADVQAQLAYINNIEIAPEQKLQKLVELAKRAEDTKRELANLTSVQDVPDYSTLASNIKSGAFSKAEKTTQVESWLNSDQGFDKLFTEKFTNTSLGNNTVAGAISDWGSQYKVQLAEMKKETNKLGNRLAGITKLSPKVYEAYSKPDYESKIDTKDANVIELVSKLHDSHPNVPIKFIEAAVAETGAVAKHQGANKLWILNSNIRDELDKALDLLDTPEGQETFKIYTNGVARLNSFESQLDNDIKALQQKYGNTSTRQLMNVDNPYMRGKRASLKQDLKHFTAQYWKMRIDQEDDLAVYKPLAKKVEEQIKPKKQSKSGFKTLDEMKAQWNSIMYPTVKPRDR